MKPIIVPRQSNISAANVCCRE